MPSRLANGAASSRFELPALDLNFGNITDGTDIPPPPDSPIQKAPTPPKTPPQSKTNDINLKDANGIDGPSPTNGNLAGTKRPADDAPLSPTGSSRQGSLRRLFSRTMLSNSYAEGQLPASGSGSLANVSRPDSRSGASVMDDRKSKRASGWFRRLRSGDQQQSKRRSSLFGFEQAPAPVLQQKSSGPPPPMIPELSHLERDEGSLGNDLFKHIK